MRRVIPASTGSRRPKGRQVRSRTSTRAPPPTGSALASVVSDRVRLTDLLTRREGTQCACPSQPAHQRPAADPGDGGAGDHAASQVDGLPRRGVVGDIGVPLVEHDLEDRGEDPAQHCHDDAEAAVPEQRQRELDTQTLEYSGQQDGNAPLVAEEELDIGRHQLGEHCGTGSTDDERTYDGGDQPDAEHKLTSRREARSRRAQDRIDEGVEAPEHDAERHGEHGRGDQVDTAPGHQVARGQNGGPGGLWCLRCLRRWRWIPGGALISHCSVLLPWYPHGWMPRGGWHPSYLPLSLIHISEPTRQAEIS